MEVNKISRAGLEQVKGKQTGTTEKVSFSAIMSRQRDQLTYERLTQLMQKIEDQGKVLAESRTVEELRKYKALVKEFMDEAVQNGLSLEERRGFNRRGRTKIYKIVTEVDKKLLELTDAVLKQEEQGLKILDLVGEIKGLLVNLYV